LQPTVSANGPTTFNEGESVTLTSSEGVGYIWSTGETTQSIVVSTSGEYWVKITDANGCESEPSISIVVTVIPVTEGPTFNGCPDAAIVLDCNPTSAPSCDNVLNLGITAADAFGNPITPTC